MPQEISCCRVVMKRNKAKQQQTELWSDATMQQVILYSLLVLKSIV